MLVVMDQEPSRVYAPGDVAERLGVSGQRIRQLAAIYERVHGELLPREKRGRVWPEEAVERLERAHAAVVDGRVASVEQALRFPEGDDGGDGASEGVDHHPARYGRSDASLAALVEELRLLRGAVEGMSRRLAAFENENRELRETGDARRELELPGEPRSSDGARDATEEAREGAQTRPSTRRQYAVGTLLIAVAFCALEWLLLVLTLGLGWKTDVVTMIVIIGLTLFLRLSSPFVLALYVGVRSDDITSWGFLGRVGLVASAVLTGAVWIADAAFYGVAHFILGWPDERSGAILLQVIQSDPIGFIVGGSVVLLASYIMFLSGGAIGHALRGRSMAAPQIHPRASRASDEEWTPRKQALVGLVGSVIGAVTGLIGTAITAIAGSG